MVPKKSCGCAGRGAPVPREEDTDVVWHNPTAYDPVRHGPPYLPIRLAAGAKVASRVASRRFDRRVAERFVGGVAPLSAVLAVLRAASFLHQTHHWQTSGPGYYADHLLFDRLYKDSQPHIDQLAEKAVALGSTELVTPARQAAQVSQVVRVTASASAEPSSLVASSLRVETFVLSVIDEAVALLRSNESLTQGTSNLLQGIADLHETFVYLLQQRIGVGYDYARKAV